MSDTQRLPILPLRDIVVFPHMVVPLFVGREKSIAALEDVMKAEKRIFLLTQKDSTTDDPVGDDLFERGCIAKILQLLKLPDGTVRVLVEGEDRAAVTNLSVGDFLEGDVRITESEMADKDHVAAMAVQVREGFGSYGKLNKKVADEVITSVTETTDAAKLSDIVAVHLGADIARKQSLLETTEVGDRLAQILELLDGEASILKVEKKIRGRVKRQMEKTQREYYLNEQMKAIQTELGGDEPDEMEELRQKVEDTKLTVEAKEKVDKELSRLKKMSPMSAEANVSRNYIDWMLSVPWGKKKRVQRDLAKAQEILDADHYGLDKVKERIIEFLAVQTRTKKVKGPILCLVGPPGVGKTSLGKSVARATGREFVRVSLGGVRDESEIRGHRRTYIGSMPGRVIQSMKKAKYNNPLFLFDEIDKMGQDHRGDPSAALLEVLDPEQNDTFNDHYLDVDYDLSDVMFITTANSLDMAQPLLDRMEIIRIPGYTEDEKVEIAKRHLIPEQTKEHGLKASEFTLSEDAVRDIIRYYTREAGVRGLKREIASLARKVLTKIVSKAETRIDVTSEHLDDLLGVKKFRYGKTDTEDQIGVVTGLAWTSVGGDILTIEALAMPGKGKMTVTGNLKNVMKESISAANSYVQAKAPELGISPRKFRSNDIHVHVPDGATPKDGPSAGIGMVTAIVSVLTEIPVRNDIAMTGEVTLRGRVTAIGGLKEKLLAALRGGVKTVLIPSENEKDLADIPDNVKAALEIIPVTHVSEVLEHALTKKITPMEWTSADEAQLAGIMMGTTGSQMPEGGTAAH
ncbi:Lon protease [Litorimonas cladophorae]|uniref:Lon protease n=1 Tax=Litorimonas cladophorae TaxID=1220491 RepID=A0A918KGM9_9PROT|nr:endopeptidase La [Litorimonas cladophorae]GGX60401.1 Lon protease [Litorimonas cladophorae]